MRWEQVFQTYSPEQKEFFLKNMPKLLAADSMIERYCEIVTDFDFIKNKVSEFDPQMLIKDYDYSLDNDLFLFNIKQQFGEEFVESLELIQRAIRLSSLTIVDNPKQIASQIWGRLVGSYSQFNPIKKLLDSIKILVDDPWICTISPCLTQATESLIQTKTHQNTVNSIIVTSNGRNAVSCSADNTIKIWDVTTGQEIHTLQGHTAAVNAIAITSDDTKIVSCSADNTIKIWDVTTGQEIHTLQGHTAAVNAIAITSDDTKIVSGSLNNDLKLWDTSSGKLIHTFPNEDMSLFPPELIRDAEKELEKMPNFLNEMVNSQLSPTKFMGTRQNGLARIFECEGCTELHCK